MSAFPMADWLSIFDTAEKPADDGALTKVEIMAQRGWSDWIATREIKRKIANGELEWVRSERPICGGTQRVVAYRPVRKA